MIMLLSAGVLTKGAIFQMVLMVSQYELCCPMLSTTRSEQPGRCNTLVQSQSF